MPPSALVKGRQGRLDKCTQEKRKPGEGETETGVLQPEAREAAKARSWGLTREWALLTP